MEGSRRRKIKKWIIKIASFFILALLALLLLPLPDVDDSFSTVIEDRNGELLGARIAEDGQWRFPSGAEVPEKFEKAIVHFEDRWFRFHPGINPISVVRALFQNLSAGEVVSGASTLTMQTIRMARKGKPRNLLQKMTEMVLALKMELVYSKRKILHQYALTAPFGGNVVGLEAAAWRFFACAPDQLSWGETAALAVLPNAPSLIYPGRNEEIFRKKRDFLLDKLLKNRVIDSLTCILAKEEPLPGEPHPLPRNAPHLLDRLAREYPGQRIKTTIQTDLQNVSKHIIEKYAEQLKRNYIHNLAALVAEVETGNILVYIANSFWDDPNGGAVDMIVSRRSTGSILKPFLYAGMLDAGLLTPGSLVPDLPVHFSGYTPKNFDLSYRGAVPASVALSRSLNIPAVSMLRTYSPARFLDFLKGIGFTTFDRSADDYGLSLILGGGEVTLEELVMVYSSWARVLNQFNQTEAYSRTDYAPLKVFEEESSNRHPDQKVVSAASIWQSFEALKEVNRPDAERGWRYLSSSSQVAWKTGTSFGFRDAWAVGVTPEYVVGVWAGNASGEGRPGLTGVSTAGPVLFELLGQLENSRWFEAPVSEMIPVAICRQSGHRASRYCTQIDTLMVPETVLSSSSCPYHQLIHLDAGKKNRVNSSCYPASKLVDTTWFVLPPAMEFYYRKNHPEYHLLPPMHENCQEDPEVPMLEFIYPGPDLMLYVPIELDGSPGKVLLEAAHRNPSETIYWHMDDVFVGSTRYIHQLALKPDPGEHTFILVDSRGNTCRRKVEVVE
jgi:penicillin-binding protein 1C